MKEESQSLDETCDKLGVGISELERLRKKFSTVKIELVDATTSDYLFKEACRKSDSQDQLEKELEKTQKDLVRRLNEKARGVRQLVVYNRMIDEAIADRCDFLAGSFTLGEFIDVCGMLAGGEAYEQAPWIRKRPELEQTDRKTLVISLSCASYIITYFDSKDSDSTQKDIQIGDVWWDGDGLGRRLDGDELS
ncbi:hypothetical protein FANTH_12346 [Fusarium anthophilum]|uniref:Uncharacterized protein n=1 Tax=Fusarium anthophilum TaxID=48485 RepID=A0A8H4YUD4_9HYPO|nr:hypothetical protein FANTH_12346 [Fusarium anthophilum]